MTLNACFVGCSLRSRRHHLERRVIGEDHVEIEIAVRSGISTGGGAKRIEPGRVIKRDQPACNFADMLFSVHAGRHYHLCRAFRFTGSIRSGGLGEEHHSAPAPQALSSTHELSHVRIQLHRVFEPAEEGGFVVTCPALPGLVTEGDTLEEARIMAQDAMRGYLESLRKDQLPIPPDTIPLSEEVHVLMPEPV